MRSRLFLHLGIFLMIIMCSCNKKAEITRLPPQAPGPPVINPTISSFTISNRCERTLTISGAHFVSPNAPDSMYINEVKGTIDSVSEKTIYAHYPATTIYGVIRLFYNGKIIVSTQVLQVDLPVVSSFYPSEAGPGALIKVSGQHFSHDITQDSAWIGGQRVHIVSATSTELVLRVPPTGATGKISVHVACDSTLSSNVFTYKNKGMVLVSGNSRRLHAVDIASQTFLWQAPVNSSFKSGPLLHHGVVYIGSSDVNNLSNNAFYALDAWDGSIKWQVQGGPWDGIATVHDDLLFAGSFDQHLYAIDTTGIIRWKYKADNYFGASPTYSNGRVYAGNDNGHFYCVDAMTGTLVWKKFIWPGGNSSVVNGIVYTVGSGRFYALSAETGVTVWSREIGSLSGGSPTVVNGVVYLGAEDHHIYALNADNGSLVWKKEAVWFISSAPIVEDGLLYTRIGDGVLEARDIATGNEIWKTGLWGDIFGVSSPVVAGGVVYVGDENGLLDAVDAKTGVILWRLATGGYKIISSPTVIDETGKVYYPGDSGMRQ